MIGNLPPLNDKKIGQDDTTAADIKKLQAEVKWMKWAIILLIAYILYKESK
jgi:hypothetical protein